MKVFIVEDNPINLELFESIIEYSIESVEIMHAENGVIAVECFKRSDPKPDIIFMDLQMPEMDGYEATKQIRLSEGGGSIPIIAVSAGIADVEASKIKDAGMNAFLAKPIDQRMVMQHIQTYVLNINNVDYTPSHSRLDSTDSKKENQDDIRPKTDWLLFDEPSLMQKIEHDVDLKQILINKTIDFLESSKDILNEDLQTKDVKKFDRDLHELIGVCRSMEMPRITKYGELVRLEKDLTSEDLFQSLQTIKKLINQSIEVLKM